MEKIYRGRKKSKQRINKIEVEEKEVKDEVETSDKKNL